MAGKQKPRQTVDVQVIEKRDEIPETAHEGEFFVRVTPKGGALSARESKAAVDAVKQTLKEQGHTIARGAAAVQARS